MSKKQAEIERDKFLLDLNAAPTRCEAAVVAQQPPEIGAIIFGKLAELWRKDYVDNRMVRLAQPTRDKYNTPARVHIVVHDDGPAEHHERGHHPRAGMGDHPRSFANPMQWVRIGRKWTVREDRILYDDETAAVFARLEDPQLLICETCLDTGTRISEAVGLQLKHFDPKKGTLRIEQRHCRGDVDEPKTKNSRRTLALGSLLPRYQKWIKDNGLTRPNVWIFFQEDDRSKPMWDSGVRKALKIAAEDAGCDFPGFGLHSFRRANITMRQEEGGSAIEASKIAGHATVSQTGDYTVVQLKRQEELTRAIQHRVKMAARRAKAKKMINGQAA